MDAIDLRRFTAALNHEGDGLWVSPKKRSVAYPTDGNESCLDIEADSFWFKHRNDVIVTMVKAFVPAGPVFDVGAGNGYVSMALQKAGFDTVAVEPGKRGALNAKARGLRIVIQAALEDCEFRDRTVPAFGLFDVLEHVQNDSDFLRRLYKHLLPKGYLYVTVPAYNFLWSNDDGLAQHYRRYTTRSLTESLESVGFKVRYCSYFFGVLMPAIFFFRVIPSRLRLRQHTDASLIKQEHAERSGTVGFLLERMLSYELRRIEKKKTLPTGSSCLAIAQKD